MAEETGDLEEAARCYSEGTHSSGRIPTYTHNTDTNHNHIDSNMMYSWGWQAHKTLQRERMSEVRFDPAALCNHAEF